MSTHTIYRTFAGLALTLAVCVGLMSCQPGGGGNVDANINENSGSGAFVLDDDGVGFPNTGSALIIVEARDSEALGSAVYYGTDNGANVYPTEVVADAGEGVIRLTLNAQGDPSAFEFDSLTTTTTYNDDGTVDVWILDSTNSGYKIDDIELEDSDKGGSPRLQQVITFDDLFACGPTLLNQIATQTLGGALDADLFDCILVQEGLIRYARGVCFVRDILNERLEQINGGCSEQPDPQACTRRVLPWIEAQQKMVDISLKFLARRIEVLDNLAECPGEILTINPNFETSDPDGDGVTSGRDLCTKTPAGAQVNKFGCALEELGAIDCRDLADSHCCSGDLVCDSDCPQNDSDCGKCGVDGMCIEDCPSDDLDCETGNGNENENDNDNSSDNENDNAANENLNDNSAQPGCEETGCPDGQACIDGECGPCSIDEDCGDGFLCIDNECVEGTDVGEGCENTGCEENEVCCNSECKPWGIPTGGVCPASFQIDFGVFEPSIKTVVFDHISLENAIPYSAICAYVREDGTGNESSIVLYYKPVGVGGNPSGMCGAEDDDGDNIVVNSGYHSTIRTLTAVDATTSSVRIVDPLAVFAELINQAIAAGVGSECCFDE